MTSLEKSWEELNLSRDEVNKLGEALKNDEFRKLLLEYVEETQKPENRKKYQEDIVQLEADRGVNCKFLNPVPGFVVKTSLNGVKKVFINMCSNSLLRKPIAKRSTQDNTQGLSWSIPYSPGPGRDDYDNRNSRCIVYDVLFHPNALQLAEKNLPFKKLIIQTALEGVESAYKVQLDRRNYKLPKMKYKGTPTSTVLREKSDKPVQLTDEEKEFQKDFPLPFKMPEKSETEIAPVRPVDDYTKPHYVIKHRTDIDLQEHTFDKNCKINSAIPKELVIEINLPLLTSMQNLTLDIKEKSLELVSEKPAKYKLMLKLPYAVGTTTGTAKFVTDKRMLLVTLPVIRVVPKSEYIREDSGVESDAGEPVVQTEMKTEPTESFLDPNLHYLLPSYDCNRDNKALCFVLNVKNVDPGSIKVKHWDKGFHTKFTSIGSGYFPIHYAFYTKFDTSLAENVSVEAWDNNVTVQAQPTSVDGTFQAGLSENDVKQCAIDDVLDLSNAVKDLAIADNPIELVSVTEDEVVFDVDFRRDTSPEEEDEEPMEIPELVPKMRTMSEGGADELNGPIYRSILKNRMNRSLSESCADDGSAFAEGVSLTWSDSLISAPRNELKKTVRFSQHIQQQTFRINSSILGQRRKNQKKTRNKRRALERRLSESENSEEGDEREKWVKHQSSQNPAVQTVITEEPEPINEKKKKGKKTKNFRSPLATELHK